MHKYDEFVENIKTIVISKSDVLCLQFTDARLFRMFMSLEAEERLRFLSPVAQSFPDTKFFVAPPGIEFIAINKEVEEETDGMDPTD